MILLEVIEKMFEQLMSHIPFDTWTNLGTHDTLTPRHPLATHFHVEYVAEDL